jgi:hypothetical protein
MANKNNSTQTKYINTNVNDYARPVTRKGNKKNVYPFDQVKVKPKLTTSQPQSSK